MGKVDLMILCITRPSDFFHISFFMSKKANEWQIKLVGNSWKLYVKDISIYCSSTSLYKEGGLAFSNLAKRVRLKDFSRNGGVGLQ